MRTRFVLVFVALFAGPSGADAQDHFAECVSNTGLNATVVLPTETEPRLNGVALPPSSEIAVFAQTNLCVGVGTWMGSSLAITIWGDDPQTSAKDGLDYGEVLEFRVWEPVSGIEVGSGAGSIRTDYDATESYLRTEGSYADDAIFSLALFDVSSPPGAPRLDSPEDGALGLSTNPGLSWTSAPFAASYHVQIATSKDFSSLVHNVDGISATSYTPSGLTSGATYFWRVRAENAEGVGAWSGMRRFQLGASTSTENEPGIAEAIELRALYPLPLRRHATVEMSVPTTMEITVQLYDAVGRRLATLFGPETVPPGINRLPVDVGNLPAGTYVIRVATSNGAIHRVVPLLGE